MLAEQGLPGTVTLITAPDGRQYILIRTEPIGLRAPKFPALAYAGTSSANPSALGRIRRPRRLRVSCSTGPPAAASSAIASPRRRHLQRRPHRLARRPRRVGFAERHRRATLPPSATPVVRVRPPRAPQRQLSRRIGVSVRLARPVRLAGRHRHRLHPAAVAGV